MLAEDPLSWCTLHRGDSSGSQWAQMALCSQFPWEKDLLSQNPVVTNRGAEGKSGTEEAFVITANCKYSFSLSLLYSDSESLGNKHDK